VALARSRKPRCLASATATPRAGAFAGRSADGTAARERRAGVHRVELDEGSCRRASRRTPERRGRAQAPSAGVARPGMIALVP